MATEPKYDEDAVNLGYLKKIVADSEGNLNNIYENVSKHYASKPQPPYHKGDTWIDGDIIYTCINDRLIGTYQDSDWVTESGAKEEAEKKNKVFLRQPSNYSVGDMWILQSDTDHRAGKKGEMLISTAGRKVYDEDDWINMLGYGTIASINEVAHNLNDAIKRIGVTEDAIADGLIVTFYQNTIPEGKHIGDLWYVTETIEQFIKGKLYRYNGEKWEILKDPEITKAFEEANEARIVADGKIQSFYTAIAPLQNVGVGDLWIDTDDNNKLYRYNGTNWVAVYDTRIDTIQKEVETITETTVEIQTDLGQINNRVNTVETTITTLGQIEKAEGKKIKVDASNNPAKLRVWGNSVQAKRNGINQLKSFSKGEKDYFSNITNTSNSNTDYWKAEPLSDNWIHIECDCTTATTQHYINTFIEPNKIPNLKASTEYTIAIEFRNVNITTMTGNLKIGNTGTGAVYFNSELILNKETFIAANNGIKKYKMNTRDKMSGSYVLRNFQGVNIGDKFSYDYRISILEGDYTNTDYTYEAYGASPSPDYPSRIRNVGDNVNLFINNSQNKTLNGVNMKKNQDGSMTFNGTATAQTQFFFTDDYPLELKPNNYVASTKYTGTFTGGNVFLNVNSLSIAHTYFKINETNNKAFTISEDINVRGYFNIEKGTILNNLTIYPKLEEGSKPTPYTPYGCGSVDIKTQNKNYLPNTYLDGKSKTMNGITFTVNEDGSITANGTATSNATFDLVKKYNIPLGSYKLVGENENYSFTAIRSSYKQNDTIKYVSSVSPFTLEGTITDFTVYIVILSGKTVNNITFYPMLLESTETDLSYQKGKSRIISFPFSKGQVLHKGDYLASDGIHQKRKTLVLNGNENWLLATAKDNTTHFQCTVTSDKKAGITNVISSHFKTQYELDENGIFGASAGSFIQIYIDKAIATTVTELKAYLQEQYANGTPVTIEYELAEEIVIPYTPEQQKVLDNIKTFKGINYIYCIDEIKPEKIELEYYPNTPYNDTLVNKDTFDKVTTDMNAEFNIKANEIETSVKESTTASILTLLNNGYLTAEQVNALVNGNAEDIATVKEQLKQTVTSSQMQIEISKAIEGGVSYLKNTLFTIDENGMTIATNQDEFNALYNNKGMYLYSFDEMIAKFDVNGATIEGNLNLNGEFVTPNLRMMNVKVSGVAHTHIHWIGG